MARVNSRPDAPALSAAEVVAGAARLGLALDNAQAEGLARFAALLLRWNAVHNLTALNSPAAVLSHHLLDSLAIVRPIESIFGENRALRILDVGAGGGLPGLPLALVRPRWDLTLVDKVEKKVAFLIQARLELQLPNVHCVHARVEDLAAPPFDLIVSRAFSALATFVRLTRPLLARGGWWGAMKGAVPEQEVEELAAACPEVQVVDVVRLRVPRLDAERHLVLLRCP